jgi:enoyl-CoA hydratase
VNNISAAELIARREGAVGRLTLNRPEALGALTTGMCEAMIAALLDWRHDPAVQAVIIDHAGPRGFCAGGDIRMLAESGAGDGAQARAFFHTEYRLNHLLSVYPKPVVTVMDGVTMGGGVGLAMPSAWRVATERTRFAMPETGIGLFPDVGGGWFLPRMPGRTGLWVVLTGARLGAADCALLGIATHVVASEQLADLKAAIAREPAAIATLLTAFAADPGPASVSAQLSDIDRVFAGDSVEAIVAALQADGGAWALAQLAAMRPKSPLSSKVSYRQLAGGAELATFADEMTVEYRLASRFVMTPNFHEGVRAVIVDKDNNPAWRPASLAEVSDAMLDEIFAALPDEWTPLPDAM